MTKYEPNHFKSFSSGIATVRACNYCKHVEIVRKGMHGVGRGYGMREGNKARGRMIQHIKEMHADKLVCEAA